MHAPLFLLANFFSALSSSGPPAPPTQLAPAFSASVTVTSSLYSSYFGPAFAQQGIFLWNFPQNFLNFSLVGIRGTADGYVIPNYTTVGTSQLVLSPSTKSCQYILGSQCRDADCSAPPNGITLAEPRQWFAWLSEATNVGVVSCGTTSCRRWLLQVGNNVSDPSYLRFSLTVESQSLLPVEWTTNHGGSTTVITFTNATTVSGPAPPAPPPCAPVPPCPVGPASGISNITLVRIHPATDYTVADRNLGDLPGDVLYLCAAARMAAANGVPPAPGYVFSTFAFSMNTTFGQYSLCDDAGQCLGPVEPTLVGREAGGSMGAVENGQCSTDSPYGYWYSPTSGAARAGAWSAATRLKSISMDCLRNGSAFANVCGTVDTFRYPLTDAVSFVKGRLADCPDVPPPSHATAYT